MSYFKPGGKAEATDRLADITGLAVGFVAIIKMLSVAQNYVPAGTADMLDAAQMVGGAVILAIYLPLFIYFKTRFGTETMNPWTSDSFVASVLKQAGLTAFSVLLLAMVVLSMLDKTVLANVSAEILLDGIIAVALAAFSVAFFAYNRAGASEDGSGDGA